VWKKVHVATANQDLMSLDRLFFGYGPRYAGAHEALRVLRLVMMGDMGGWSHLLQR
jgi:hypothetical protein